jgi:hypothetical protein
MKKFNWKNALIGGAFCIAFMIAVATLGFIWTLWSDFLISAGFGANLGGVLFISPFLIICLVAVMYISGKDAR